MSDIQFMKLANRANEILDDIQEKLLEARKAHEADAAVKQAA